MKTTILPLAIALAFSFTATPAAGGLSNQTKCDSGKLLAAAKFSQCRIKVDFLALKKGAKLSAEKKLELQAKCDTKLTEAYDKLEGKYPETMSGGDDECGSYDDAQNMMDALVAVSDAVADGSVSAEGSASAELCPGRVCAPADVPGRDCFREGACGEDGWELGSYAFTTSSSTGCSDTEAGTYSYNRGKEAASAWGFTGDVSGWQLFLCTCRVGAPGEFPICQTD
jgi:hypothetical protein